jgi:hypothetical protein
MIYFKIHALPIKSIYFISRCLFYLVIAFIFCEVFLVSIRLMFTLIFGNESSMFSIYHIAFFLGCIVLYQIVSLMIESYESDIYKYRRIFIFSMRSILIGFIVFELIYLFIILFDIVMFELNIWHMGLYIINGVIFSVNMIFILLLYYYDRNQENCF